MAEEYADFLIRIRAKDKATGTYPVEAILGDGRTYPGGELRIDFQELWAKALDPEAYGRQLFESLFSGPMRRARVMEISRISCGSWTTRSRVRLPVWP